MTPEEASSRLLTAGRKFRQDAPIQLPDLIEADPSLKSCSPNKLGHLMRIYFEPHPGYAKKHAHDRIIWRLKPDWRV